MYICMSIYPYIYTYVYYMILLYLEGSGSKFHSVNTKTSQFWLHDFLESRSWEKNMSTPKLVNFQHFGFQELRKNMYVYNIILCIYVHMYSTWFCYIWRVVVLSFIPSTPKLVNFANFLESRSLRKKHVNTKTSQFPPFFGFQELTKKYVNTKTSQFSPFLDSRSWEKTCMYIYI